MSNDRMPKKLLFGQGQRLRGRRRSSSNDVVLSDCQDCHIHRPFRMLMRETTVTTDQDRLLYEDVDLPCTYLAHMSWKALLT